MKRFLLVVVPSALLFLGLPGLAELPSGPEEPRLQAMDAALKTPEGQRPAGKMSFISQEHAEHLAEMRADRAEWFGGTDEEGAPTQLHVPGGPPLPIYLNRWGGTYFNGFDDSANNLSSLVQGASATLAPFAGNDHQWETLLECVQDQFAPFNVYVTDIEPTEGGYVECVTGGTPDQLGQPYGVGGVAPYDPYNCNMIDNAIVYAFAGVYGTSSQGLQSLCETVTQEVAHSFTLDHELLCEDPMTYLSGCGDKSFQNVTAACGEDSPRDCTCGDPNGQNSVQMLITQLGANAGVEPPAPPDDHEVPVVAFIAPEPGATLLAGENMIVHATASDDVGLVSVQLIWELTETPMYCPGVGNGWACQSNGEEFVWTIDAGPGLREFHIEARDVVGNLTATETRWVWLGESLDEERPEDEIAPEVTLISPAPFTTVAEREGFTIVATVYDADTGVLGAQLAFESPWGVRAIGCPIEGDDRFACEIVGGTYIWTVWSGRSDKTFQVYGTDYLGNVGASEQLPILVDNGSVTPTPANDELEFNDTWDFPTPADCDTQLDLLTHRSDPDWFTLDAPEGHKVSVVLGGDLADQLDLFVHLGPTSESVLVGHTHEAGTPNQISFFNPPGGTRLRVQPSGDREGAYSLSTGCEEPPPPPVTEPPVDDTPVAPFAGLPLSCSHLEGRGGHRPFGLVAIAAVMGGLLRRRRR